MCSKVSHCRFQENSGSKLINENNSATLWDEFTHPKTVSQRASFWFLFEDISYVTVDFNVLHNILLKISWKHCYQTAPWKECCNSVTWIHTSQSIFSESFFIVYIWGYFLFHYGPQCTPKYPFVESMKTVTANCSMK